MNLPELVKQYLLSCQVRGLRPATIANYRHILERYATFALSLSINEIERWFAYLELPTKTLRRYLAYLKAFASWAADRELLDAKSYLAISKYKLLSDPEPNDSSRIRWYTKEEFSLIISRLRPPVLANIFEFMGRFGLRVKEAMLFPAYEAIATLEQLKRENGGVAYLRVPGQIAKNRKDRYVPALAPSQVQLLRRLVARYELHAPEHGLLFYNKHKQPLKYTTLHTQLLRMESEVGLPLAFHNARRYFIDSVSKQLGIEIGRLVAGHSSLRQTEHYTSLTAGDVAAFRRLDF